MKIILGIFCGLMLLFAGGCALVLVLGGSSSSHMTLPMPAVLITGGVAALNLLVLITLFGSGSKHVWAFYVLAALDVVVVAILAIMWISIGFRDSEINAIGTILVGGLALKALLTFIAAKKV
jgi:hypothetical protein